VADKEIIMADESLQEQAMQMEQGQEPEAQEDFLEDQEEEDLEIAVNLAKEMIDDGGYELLDSAVQQSKDPGQVIGQFLMQLGSRIFESMPEDLQLSPRIMLSHNGWVEQVSDYLQEQYGITKEVMDRAESYIGAAAMQMAQGGQQTPGQPPAEAQPAAPEGAPVLPGGM
jgi:hypothetical protein